MGCYINPEEVFGLTKEEWLIKNGAHVAKTIKWAEKEEGHLIVVLVDNGMFTAAGIAYCEKEFKEFTNPTDPRPRELFSVPLDRLLIVEPSLHSYLTLAEQDAIAIAEADEFSREKRRDKIREEQQAADEAYQQEYDEGI